MEEASTAPGALRGRNAPAAPLESSEVGYAHSVEKEKMTESIPIQGRLAFHHLWSTRCTEMIESYCENCEQFIAASTCHRLLDIAEANHLCPRSPIRLQRKPPTSVR